MTQYDPGLFEPTDSGVQLATDLNGLVGSLYTNHKGPARPSYVRPGMLWIDDAGAVWLLKLFDGEQDITIAGFDPATHALTTAGVPTSRKVRTGAAFLLNGVAGTDAAPAEADLTADLLIKIDLAAKALTQSVWGAGVSDVVAPISPEQLAATIASQAGGGGWDLVVEDRKSSGTAAGLGVIGGWTTRALNTLVVNDLAATLSGNVVTIPLPGGVSEANYEVEWDAPGGAFLGSYTTALYDGSGALLAAGTPQTGTSYNSWLAINRSHGYARIHATASITLSVKQFFEASVAGGFAYLGRPSNSGNTEIYTRMRVRKV